ncbi:ABC transporter permease [Skermania sp. ID1734]|nr:ABC transporter permease [Skermania sp. ID1734]
MLYVNLAIGVAVLLAVTSAVMAWAGIRPIRTPWWAIARATTQLALISIALRGVFTHAAWVAAALLAMFAVATWTTGHRLRDLPGSAYGVVIACGAGAGIALVIAFAARTLAFDARYVIALGGIVIGNTMTASTLAGRHFRSGVLARRDEIEGWLALGATPSQSVLDVGRSAAHEAVLPVTDQTRTTGLVTLPGAFVGALMGGASPLDAGRFQLVVLATIIAGQTITAVLLVRILGRSPTLVAEPVGG